MATIGTLLLVSGDNLPAVKVLLSDQATGLPLDLSVAGTTVSVKIRQVGTTTILSTLPATFVTNGADGLIVFSFAPSGLDVTPGYYEFEVVIDWNGLIQTVFDVIRAQVRAAF